MKDTTQNRSHRLQSAAVANVTVPETLSHKELEGAVPAGDHDAVTSRHTSKKCECGCQGRHKFKGYTLDELRMRKVVSELKINATKDRIALLVSPQVKGEVKTISNCISGFDTFLKYFDIAMLAYGITRRISGFFARFSRRK